MLSTPLLAALVTLASFAPDGARAVPAVQMHRVKRASQNKMPRAVQVTNSVLQANSGKVSNNGKTRPVSTPAAPAPAPSYTPIVGTYYADWTGDSLPPEKVDWSKFDLVYYAFALPSKTGTLYWTQDDSESILNRTVALAHKAGAKVVVSCGGWTGSTYFSDIVRTASGRVKLANAMYTLIKTFNLDGIDIDWEYPGLQGNNNAVSGADSANLALFLQQLRGTIGANKLITMATSQQPFADANGQPLQSVAAQAAYLDHILIMNYDVYASSSRPGPNAPLSNACAKAQYPWANAVAAIAAWTAAGMKANQLILGVPYYGYVSSSSATTLLQKRSMLPRDLFWEGQKAGAERRLRARQIAVDPTVTDLPAAAASASAAAAATLAPAGGNCPLNHGGFGCADNEPSASHPAPPNPSTIIKASGSGDLSSFMGQQIGFSSIVQLGALIQSGKSNLTTYTSSWIAHAGYTRYWDTCSSTPFLRNAIRNTVVTYDDEVSLQLKAAYAYSMKIGGAASWSLDGDTSTYTLTCAVRAGLGKSC